MKNYVVRFANDQLKAYEKAACAGIEMAIRKYSEITRIVSLCDREMITDFEAVSAIVDVVKGD